MRYISMMLVCLMHTSLCSMQCYAWLACFVPSFGSLCFFASLHACLHVHAWVLVLACVIKPNSYHLVWVHTCPWYTRPQVLYRNFAWWHMCHHTPVDTLRLLDHPSQRCFRAFHLSVLVREYMDMEEVCCTLGVWLESESILKKLPRVSEVVTNHWVFLRCDWSPDFIWFYYWS